MGGEARRGGRGARGDIHISISRCEIETHISISRGEIGRRLALGGPPLLLRRDTLTLTLTLPLTLALTLRLALT